MGDNARIGNEAAQINQAQKLKQSPQYQKIQQEIAQKQNEQKTQDIQKVKPPDFQDKVEIKSLFNWKVNKEGDFEIKAENQVSTTGSTKSIKFSGEKILRLLGYKIDISEKVDSMKENYMRLFIESKSHNLLLAKFSQIKFGMLTTMLSVLGVTTKELQDLQKKALNESVEDNIKNYEQNEYNSEMMYIFGTGKKDKKKQKIFDEVRTQLTQQMARLGQQSYYNQEKIITIKKEQVQKIKQDLVQEKQNLDYLREFQS